MDREMRFWAKVVPVGECLIWAGATTHNGYGLFGKGGSGRTMLAHHYLKGRPPAGMETHHVCGNPSCVSPLHLEFLTRAEHGKTRRKTHCRHGHPYSGENLKFYKNGLKYCLACSRITSLAHYYRKKETRSSK